MKPVRVISPAKVDFLEATEFYHLQQDDLGEQFVREFDAAVEDVAANPEKWPRIEGNVRRRLLKRFPYSVLYVDKADEVIVLAVAHQSRHPRYWADRLKES